MDVICRVDKISLFSKGKWGASLSARDLQVLGKPLRQGDGCHIIGIREPTVSSGALEFSADGAVIFNLGNGEDALLVDLSAQENLNASHPTGLTKIDDGFFHACRYENMPSDMIAIARDFLVDVRKYSSDTLVEGKARKWVTSPINFLALTIQNTKKRFAINLKDTPYIRSLENIDVTSDRPGHIRFILDSRGQLQDAIAAARDSFKSVRKR